MAQKTIKFRQLLWVLHLGDYITLHVMSAPRRHKKAEGTALGSSGLGIYVQDVRKVKLKYTECSEIIKCVCLRIFKQTSNFYL